MLIDNFNRVHDYLRVSITDKCNFSCSYCIPVKSCHFLSNEKLMTVNELFEISKIFVQLGIKKIRITGGEPLIRPDFPDIIKKLFSLNIQLTITTNGYYIDKYIDILSTYIKSINVSLDTLDTVKFLRITGKDAFEKIYNNIHLLLKYNFHPKINVVLIKGINDDEVTRFLHWTKNIPIHIRFIEYMPFESNKWNKDYVVSLDEILNSIKQSRYDIIKLKDEPNSTSKAFQIKGFQGTFAVISTVSNPFCDTCNRIRLTADGKLRNCLFARSETDILTPFRNNEDIIPLIKQNISNKFKLRGGLPDFNDQQSLLDALSKRKMIEIGG